MTDQRTAIVTGAASGIGRATTERLLGDGWRVVGIDLRAAMPPNVTAVVGDERATLGIQPLPTALLARVEARFGVEAAVFEDDHPLARRRQQRRRHPAARAGHCRVKLITT